MASFEQLLEKYRRDEMAETELEEFLALLEADASPVAAPILEDLQNNAYPGLTDPAQRARMLARILEQNHSRRLAPVYRLLKIAAAVAAILLALVSTWLLKRQHPARSLPNPPVMADIAPGGNKAILTLADGSRITLDSAHNGKLALQGNTRIVNADGQLVYHPGNKASIVYNTVTTPRGGGYRLTLADGTKVWLNSASSLRYPSAFTANTRSVELTGEAYFEVATDKNSPFIVHSGSVNVEVLGTHFDIMAYPDENAINTTLIEGSVRVTRADQARTLTPGQARTLAPGQEALVAAGNPTITVQPADIDKAIAWTTGFFKFDHTDLHTIMREIARWYDIDIIYQTNDNTETYGGRIRRDLNLSALINFLEANGIHHFRIDGKKLIVLP